MLSLYIKDKSLIIKDVDKGQIAQIAEWFNGREKEHYRYAMGMDGPVKYEDLHEKYLESLVSVSEFFLSVNLDDVLVGFVKGRLDYRNEGEIWIMAILIDKKFQNQGIGKRIIKLIMRESAERFGIKTFYAGIVEDNKQGMAFWKSLKFCEYRQSKGYFTLHNKSRDLMIMYRKI
ncbi:MAG TPA: hypothetical protein DD429_09180 [Clostridiaceae bacterium]|nr:hypothetical protein [Clostridiaceae bacterium]